MEAQAQPLRNRHPVDELAEVRAEAKRLKDREDELRKQILDGSCGLIGYDHEAKLSETESERVDVKAARAALGDQLAPFLKTTRVKMVRLAKREAPEPDAA